jgi:hypothetical protein
MLSNNMYALEGYKRVYMPGKGYVDVSKAYPKGVPRSMGRHAGGGVLLARIARGNVTGFSPAEVAYAREINDPRNTPLGHAIGTSSFRFPGIIPAEFTLGTSAERAALSSAYESRVTGTTASQTAKTGIAAGGSALAQGGPALGLLPGAGLDLSGATGGIGSSIGGITDTIKGLIPTALTILLAIIVIKIVLWLIRGRR